MLGEITGSTLPVLQVQLSPGETLIAEPGSNPEACAHHICSLLPYLNAAMARHLV